MFFAEMFRDLAAVAETETEEDVHDRWTDGRVVFMWK